MKKILPFIFRLFTMMYVILCGFCTYGTLVFDKNWSLGLVFAIFTVVGIKSYIKILKEL